MLAMKIASTLAFRYFNRYSLFKDDDDGSEKRDIFVCIIVLYRHFLSCPHSYKVSVMISATAAAKNNDILYTVSIIADLTKIESSSLLCLGI